MAPSERVRSKLDRALCRRLRDGFRERGGRTADAGRPQGAAGQIWPCTPRGQNAPDRVWPPTGPNTPKARRAASRDLRLPGLHPLLWMDPGRQVHRQAQDAEQAPVAKADSAAPGRVADHARAAGRAASLVLQRAARPLWLLRHAAQLALSQRVPARRTTYLVQLPEAAKPEKSADGMGLVRRCYSALAFAPASDHTPLDTTRGMTRVTSGKSRVRESRLPGSVRAKPNGLATRPRPD